MSKLAHSEEDKAEVTGSISSFSSRAGFNQNDHLRENNDKLKCRLPRFKREARTNRYGLYIGKNKEIDYF